jgi:hypothetical protein
MVENFALRDEMPIIDRKRDVPDQRRGELLLWLSLSDDEQRFARFDKAELAAGDLFYG